MGEYPDVVALRGKVKAEVDATTPVGIAHVDVTLVDGRALSQTVASARGSLERPSSDAEIEAKVRPLAAGGGSDCEADRVIEAVWTLDRDHAGLDRPLAAPA